MSDTSFTLFPPEFLPGYSVLPEIDSDTVPKDLTPVPATVYDAHAMSILINEYAAGGVMLAKGPQYLYQNIREYYVIKMPVSEEIVGPLGAQKEIVIACVSLHVLWEDLAEVRSLAVHPQLKRFGLGRLLVDHVKEEAKKYGIRRLFAFTLRPDFFQAMDFYEVPRQTLPPVVWSACSNCPKFYKCDEIGMMYDL